MAASEKGAALPSPSPQPKSAVADFGTDRAQVGQARLAMGEGRGGGSRGGIRSRPTAPTAPKRTPSATPHKGETKKDRASRGGSAAVPCATTPTPDPSPAEPRYSEGSATQKSDRSRQQPTSIGGGE